MKRTNSTRPKWDDEQNGGVCDRKHGQAAMNRQRQQQEEEGGAWDLDPCHGPGLLWGLAAWLLDTECVKGMFSGVRPGLCSAYRCILLARSSKVVFVLLMFTSEIHVLAELCF